MGAAGLAGSRRRHDDQLRRSRTPIPWTDAASPIRWPTSAPSISGTGQYYLMTIRDKDGKPLEGGGTYRLNVPANAPVKLYWSATVYDRATHALIRDQPWSSRVLDDAGPAEERRRFGGRLLRPKGAGRQGVELGADERRTESSKCCSASTAPRSRSSTRRGCCRTSRRSPRNEQMGANNEVSCFCSATAGVHQRRAGAATRFPSPPTTSSAPRSDLYFGGIVKDRARSASSSTTANRRRSTIRPSSASTATRFIRLRCSISMPDRSRSRCPMPASASCR